MLSNPFISKIQVSINSPQKQSLQITINNMAGQTISKQTISINKGINLITFNAATYSYGIYNVNISSATGTINLKALK